MSSKQLSSLLRKAPPATVPEDEPEAIEISPEPVRAKPVAAKQKTAGAGGADPGEDPKDHPEAALPSERGGGSEPTHADLRGIQSLGIEVPKDELNSRRRKLS